jgi:hypothetical protein
MNMINKEPERHELEALLPWHATGTLNRRDSDRVERALEGDRELARRYDLVREELAETIHLNETLGAPSARAMEKLFAAIDAEEARSPRRQRSFGLAQRVSELLSGISPRTLAWSATAAALAIVLQAGLIAGLYVEGEKSGKGFQTASYPQTDTLNRTFGQGSYLLIRFAPTATAAEVAKYLEVNKLGVVDGPRAGGLYKVRVTPPNLSKEDLGRIAKRMQDDSKIVSFVAPTE